MCFPLKTRSNVLLPAPLSPTRSVRDPRGSSILNPVKMGLCSEWEGVGGVWKARGWAGCEINKTIPRWMTWTTSDR